MVTFVPSEQVRMQNNGNNDNTEGKQKQEGSAFPNVSLPKGGGAIRSMGEKFSTNPVTGTASFSIPLPASSGRSGFGPSLSLSYDSGNGNGIFGLGWSLSLPSITRSTKKQLPRYKDDEESDIFLLSGSEDLVPVLRDDGTFFEDRNSAPGYVIRRYSPRIEDSFSRIERWSKVNDSADVHWRITSPDNVLTTFGLEEEYRIINPVDPSQIFTWLVSEIRDCKGNAVLYRYKKEDGAGIDLADVHQQNRGLANDIRRTSNRYLKSIVYGNNTPLLDENGNRPRFVDQAQIENAGWLFQAVFDYGEHDASKPMPVSTPHEWTHRQDSFSHYLAGFEIRTSRLCKRFLMFHHFQAEANVGMDCLVRSTDFVYNTKSAAGMDGVYTFLTSAQQCGYRRKGDGYFRKLLPPIDLAYSQPFLDPALKDVDSSVLENTPAGLASQGVQFADLYSEGSPGLLTTGGSAWYFNRNTAPINTTYAEERLIQKPMFDPLELVLNTPNVTASSQWRLLDVAGHGLASVFYHDEDAGVVGFYENDKQEGWLPFAPLKSTINHLDLFDARVKLIDLDGDGVADALIPSENVWYPSLGEDGFGPPRYFPTFTDEEEGPTHLLFTQPEFLHFADISGDGLQDIVRVCNEEICYWPNLGFGRFGAKVTMGRSPIFDSHLDFRPNRIILADIDGSGTTDVVYLHSEGAKVFFNQCGNSWSDPLVLDSLSHMENDVSVDAVDLLGNGTTCLVVSSPYQSDFIAMRYLDLMTTKPHLLTRVDNNLGSVTEVTYAPSTKFYLQDKRAGMPWVTRLQFPVHVVESVRTYDRISKCMFASTYAYHHGYYDPEDSEFRGFGMVEQWDTAEISALTGKVAESERVNVSLASDLTPVHTKTWFHLGAFLDRNSVSLHYEHEYFSDPSLSEDVARKWFLPDTVLSPEVGLEDEHDACRALKGKMLRQEVYTDDSLPPSSTDQNEVDLSRLPHTVTETNFSVRLVQPRSNTQSAIIHATVRETISHQYERGSEPRITHSMVIETNEFGQILKEVTVGYGRSKPDMILPTGWDREVQRKTYVTYSENAVTNKIDDNTLYPGSYRVPQQCEARSFELTGFDRGDPKTPFLYETWTKDNFDLVKSATEIGFEEEPDISMLQKRLLKQSRTLFRKSDLTGNLPLTKMDHMALSGQSYRLAFTSSMLDKHLENDGRPLIPNIRPLLTRKSTDEGGYVISADLKALGLFAPTDPDDCYWVPSGETFYSLRAGNPTVELQAARSNFYLPKRFRNPFGAESTITYDDYNLLIVDTIDSIGNRKTIGERNSTGTIVSNGNDYRVLQPRLMTDANRNRNEVAYDAFGLAVGTAVKGKLEDTPQVGDDLSHFEPDVEETLTSEYIQAIMADPDSVLEGATSRILYDAFTYMRTKDTQSPQPATTYTLSRMTHKSDLRADEKTEVQHAFTYSDGFGRQIQQKSLTKSGPVLKRDSDGNIVLEPDADGHKRPVLTDHDVEPRWISDGWVVYNNKGLPIRQYEPFFTDLYNFEFDVRAGVSPVIFYDALGRVVATLYPNSTYTKQIFDPWSSTVWDNNDTVKLDPREDPDVKRFMKSYFDDEVLAGHEFKTWLQRRQAGGLGTEEETAAQKTLPHADTPSVTYLDSLGRAFLAMSHNKVAAEDHQLNGTDKKLYARTEMDIIGNVLAARDAMIQEGDDRGRIVTQNHYDMLGRPLHTMSMEKGHSFLLVNVLNQPMRAWNNRGHVTRSSYDQMNRLVKTFVFGDALHVGGPNQEVQVHRTIYGESHPEAEARNLRGTVYMTVDQAMASTTERIDFKGNKLETTQRICREYRNTVDWAVLESILPNDPRTPFDASALAGVLDTKLESDTYRASSAFDALNRLLTSQLPCSAQDAQSRLRLGYKNLSLVTIDYNIRNESASDELVWTRFIKNLDYNAMGKRVLVDYGNGVHMTSEFDLDTGDLKRRTTWRGDNIPNRARDLLQDINYTYDPVGHIMHVIDNAQETNFFRNVIAGPINTYTYDALYQLIEATGREHLGQPPGPPVPYTQSDSKRFGVHPGDAAAMGLYTERYTYDDMANMIEMKHDSSDTRVDVASRTWTRTFKYEESSLIELNKTGNRLSYCTVGRDRNDFVYDTHGNTIYMPHLGGSRATGNVKWDYLDQMKELDLGGGGTAYYTYDSTGKRIRKVIEKGPNLTEERLYLGPVEFFRKKTSSTFFERESVHVFDNSNRVALVESRVEDTAGSDRAPARLIRYQIATPNGSSAIELDDEAKTLSYEEYSPYGSTTYQASTPTLETPKRYRFTSKERDEESGLSYHEARYYAPWLARWINVDPLGTGDGLNVYLYCHADPIGRIDPTGNQGVPDESFVSFDPLMSSIDNSDFGKSLVEPRPALTPLAKTMTKSEAREYGNKQAAQQRASPAPETPLHTTKTPDPMEGADVQAGHSVTARHAPESGISKPDWDQQEFQRLHSRKGQGLDVAVMSQDGSIEVTTRHRAQDYSMIDPAIDDVKKANGMKLTPDAQLEVGKYTVWRSENVPLDQGRVEMLQELGADGAPKRAWVDPTITKEMKAAAKEGDLFSMAAKQSKKAGKGAKALKLLGKGGKKLLAAVPFVGAVMGHASAAEAAMSGDIQGAALDEFGNVPVAGDLLDAARGGMDIGAALDAGLGISDVAAGHGEDVRKFAKDIGFSEDTAFYIGAGGAALSSITVAPRIALENTIKEWWNGR
ncbi:RHS repeat-associated core domain protein [Aaosphaeria arxii CBS 175.79]|uniref:RHS repeat-associated core domain protein n=1 Tax=Aaosphaeria arxii CBS 175.79 TaxID=1450172 RepID=A0A6A5XJ93_9PLEO|nr:RHS repeat-associated core domain protein [Aaosphaeria arxii CBS 175.79]KAF2012901.1 RHS repeat-associated core domain protein [Aaosphaeria arxii CBS 175.79]